MFTLADLNFLNAAAGAATIKGSDSLSVSSVLQKLQTAIEKESKKLASKTS